MLKSSKSLFYCLSHSNQAVQPQKMARGMKFRIKKVEELYYLCSENKGTVQLRGYREADLRLFFSHMQKNGFLTMRLVYLSIRTKPLAMYLYSNDQHLTEKFMNACSSGSCCVNDCIMQMSGKVILIMITGPWNLDPLKPHFYMSLALRKPFFGVSDLVRHKPSCTATEDC